MVLHRQNDRVLCGGKAMLYDCRHDVSELDLGGKCVPVVNDRISILSVPGVQFDAPAAREQRADVCFYGRIASELIAHQVPEKENTKRGDTRNNSKCDVPSQQL